MTTDFDMLAYYRARAGEYEQVYAKPERQADLAQLTRELPAELQDRRVLEIACGTGYWTRHIASRAATITATDLAPEVLELRERARGAQEFSDGDRGDPSDHGGWW